MAEARGGEANQVKQEVIMDPKTKDLILLFTDAEIILGDARSLADELRRQVQAARDGRRAQHKEFQEFMAELRETLIQIKAQFRVEAQLLNLIRPKAGEKKCQRNDGESNSSQSRMLKQFAKSTH
jgi:hypothetical protein